MKVLYCVAALAGTMIPSAGMASSHSEPAAAAATPGVAVGAVVYDPQGGEVGKVDSITGDNVVIDTGTNKATLPKSSFGKGKKGPTISATKAQIDEAVAASVAQAKAAVDAALIVGAEVRGKAGNPIGTIKEVTPTQVVLNRPSGLVSLNRGLFASQGGAVILRLTSAELDAAASQSTTTVPASTADATPATPEDGATDSEETASTDEASPDEAAPDQAAAPHGGGEHPRH